MPEQDKSVDKHRKRSRRCNHEGGCYPRLDGRWQAAIMYEGKRVYFYSNKKKCCLDWLAEMRAKILQGRPITDSEVPLSTWVDHYVETYSKGYTRPNTIANYIGYAKRVKTHPVGKVKLCKITTDHIQVFLNDQKRLDDGGELKSHTKRNIRLFLIGALTAAENAGLVWRNAAKGTRIRVEDSEKRPYLTDEDVQKLIWAAEGHPWQIGIRILCTSGMRVSELLALRRSSITAKDGVQCFHITQAVKREYVMDAKPGAPKTVLHLASPKTTAGIRFVPVAPGLPLDVHFKAQDELANRSFGLYIDDPFIVGDEAAGYMVSPERFRTFFAKCVKEAGLSKKVTPHALRHYAAQAMIRKGVSAVACARVLGHAQPSTSLNFYCEESIAGAFEAVKAISGF